LGNVEQNKKPLKLDNYRGITTAKVILISFIDEKPIHYRYISGLVFSASFPLF
jgi:hypothetical protein